MIRPKWNQLWSQANLDTCWLCDLGQSHLTVQQFPHQANLSYTGLVGRLNETCAKALRGNLALSHCWGVELNKLIILLSPY